MPGLKFIRTAVFTLVVVTAYQNCSTSGSGENPYSSVDASLACDPTIETCPNTNANFLYLGISTVNPVLLQTTDSSFNVVGDCSGVGFQSVNVFWAFMDANKVVYSQGVTGCDSTGRFSLNVTLPGGYNYAQTSTFQAEAKGRLTATGADQSNPGGAPAMRTLQVMGVSN